jgi:hypothetical protein
MNEVPLFPWWLTFTFAVFGAVGSLIGVIIGHLLTRSSERKRWRLDKEAEEYRDLLDALSAAYLSLGKIELARGTDRIRRTPEPLQEEDAAFRLLRDRMFVASKIRRGKILERWTEACKRFTGGQDTYTEFSTKYDAIADTIIRLATGKAP